MLDVPINFLGKFVPNLTSKTARLRELLQKNTAFRWTDRHEKECKKLKETKHGTRPDILLSSKTHKDFHRCLIRWLGSRDASNSDKWRPVAHASRAMTQTELRFVEIEKTLGLVFGCGKFHGCVYGLPTFTVETDHKPLRIRKKNLGLPSAD